MLATSLPSSAADVLGDGILGVLGQDFLSQFNYTLDYRSSRLWWDDEDQIETGSAASGVVLFTNTPADRLPVGTAGPSVSLFARVSFRNHEGYMVVEPRCACRRS